MLDTKSLDHILKVFEERGVAHWWDGPVEDFLTPELKAKGGVDTWRKGTDTMDVWFDSGTSWSMLGELRDSSPGRLHHADICLEGSDQHRGWFQSQLLTAIGYSILLLRSGDRSCDGSVRSINSRNLEM